MWPTPMQTKARVIRITRELVDVLCQEKEPTPRQVRYRIWRLCDAVMGLPDEPREIQKGLNRYEQVVVFHARRFERAWDRGQPRAYDGLELLKAVFQLEDKA